VKEKHSRPLIRHIPDNELRGHIIKKFSDRKIYYQQATVRITEDDGSVDRMIDKIFHA
jgi:shikimate kinase